MLAQALNARLRPHFGHPAGPLGALAGAVMALENRSVNRLVVDELEVGPEDRVLELGCGPGLGVAEATRRATHGLVIGVDPSAVMVRQARRRTRRAAAGRVAVERASAEELPLPEAHVTCAFAVNSVQHWRSTADGLSELHRVLRPLGRFVLARRRRHGDRPGLHPHAHGATDVELDRFEEELRRAGFVELQRRDHRLRHQTLVTVSGRRPA
jgi:ubiquinone/menaquinone biosynthesis C-methylase UbiE